MDKEQFRRNLLYEATMNLFRNLLKSGAISEDDFKKMDEEMIKKYAPVSATLR